jgi:hypothetical protein
MILSAWPRTTVTVARDTSQRDDTREVERGSERWREREG